MSLITLNLSKLRAQARSKSGVNAKDYPDALLDDQLNVGYVALATMLAALGEDYFEEQNVKFDLIANSSLYSLPTDCMMFKGARLAYSGTPTKPTDYVVATSYNPASVHYVGPQEEDIPTSNPIFDLTNNFVRYKPTPKNNVVNGGRIDYIAFPSALVNTADVPVIPVRYHDKISVYGGKEMAFKYEKWSKHDRLENEWNQVMADLEEKLADRDLNAPLSFRAPGESTVRRVREL